MLQPAILTSLLRIVRDLASQVSEQCLAVCLNAIAALANKSNEAAMAILAESAYSEAIQRIATEFQSYPSSEFQMASAQIVASCHKSAHFSSSAGCSHFSGHVLRWTLSSLVSLIVSKLLVNGSGGNGSNSGGGGSGTFPIQTLICLIESATSMI